MGKDSRRFAYADPPYPGCAHLYKSHADFAGEVDHQVLLHRLQQDFDGFVLHTSSPALFDLLPMVARDCRIMPWVKPFAAFKRNVPVAYAWEPIIVRPVRKPVVSGRVVMRDWFSHSITMKRGMAGAKPEKLAHWVFEVAGLNPEDHFADLFPGTGAVSRAWDTWCASVGGSSA